MVISIFLNYQQQQISVYVQQVVKVSRRSDGGKSIKMSFKNVRYSSRKTVSNHLNYSNNQNLMQRIYSSCSYCHSPSPFYVQSLCNDKMLILSLFILNSLSGCKSIIGFQLMVTESYKIWNASSIYSQTPHPLLSVQLQKSRNFLLLTTLNVTSIKRSLLLSGAVTFYKVPARVFLLFSPVLSGYFIKGDHTNVIPVIKSSYFF